MDTTSRMNINSARSRDSGAIFDAFCGLAKVLAAFFIVFTLFGASASQASPSLPEHGYTSPDTVPADGGDPAKCDPVVVCAPFLLSATAGGKAFIPPAASKTVTRAHLFLRYMSPQVDLPPPRNTA